MSQVITTVLMGLFFTWSFLQFKDPSYRIEINGTSYIKAIDCITILIINAVFTLITYGLLELI